MVIFLDFLQLRLADLIARQFAAKPLDCSQVLESLSCDLTEYHIFEVQERAWGEGDQESAVACILLAYAA